MQTDGFLVVAASHWDADFGRDLDPTRSPAHVLALQKDLILQHLPVSFRPFRGIVTQYP